MRIEVKERGKEVFYDEFLYVLTKYKKLSKNPHKKAHALSKEAITLLVVSLLMFLFVTALYISNVDRELYRYLGLFFSVLIAFSIYYLIIIKRRIASLRDVKDTIVIDFEKEYIDYSTSNNKYQIKWDAIISIIINKHSICFLPTDVITIPVVGISTDYIEQTMQAIKECGKENLIVDNTKK